MRDVQRRLATFQRNGETVTGLAVVAFTVFCLCCGCERENSSSVDVLELPFSEVLVNVDGEKITVKEYDCRLGLECAVYGYMNRTKPANQLGSMVERFRASRFSVILPELINQKLIKDYLMIEQGWIKY